MITRAEDNPIILQLQVMRGRKKMIGTRGDLFSENRIDPAKPIPYHSQVYQALERVITTSMRPGEQLPGEPRLCEAFGVSRTVIRQALDQLTHAGLVTRVMGKGTFVAEPKIPEALLGSLTGFHEDMVAKGYAPHSKVLRQEQRRAPSDVAHYLALSPGADVIELRRLRFVNQIPIQLVTTYIPGGLCPGLLEVDFTHQSLYAYLDEVCELHIARGKRMIEAVLATEDVARLLEVRPGTPLIKLESVSYLADGTPLEYYHAVHRSDRARFEVELVRAHNSRTP